MRADKPLKRNI